MAIIRGTSIADTLNGVGIENDIIYGLGNNDVINGNDGNDQLYGEAAFYNGKYYLFTDVLSWTAAQAQAVSLGGTLVTVNDVAENSWLQANFGGQGNLWLGLTDDPIEGIFRWANNEAITYTNWASGQPVNITGLEDYASFNVSTGQWSTLPNTTLQRGIIEISTALTGNDTLNGGNGNDTLFGGVGSDRLDGGTGTDTADYSGFNQAITLLPTGVVNKGTLGTDNLVAIERIIGANGLNNVIDATTATTSFAAATINANLLTQTVTVNAGLPAPLSFTVVNFRNVIGTNNNDTITGDNNANTLTGNAGDDNISGNDGNDTINGGIGNDTINGGLGNDSILGGIGDDSLIGSTGSDTLNGETGTDTADYSTIGQAITLLPTGVVTKGTSGTDNLIGIERIIGATSLNNIIDTSTATNSFAAATINANLLTQSLTVNAGLPAPLSFTVVNFRTVIGTNNNDTITGDNNANTLTGNAGNDNISGNEGNDTINGGIGNDILDGGIGNDSVLGGTGNDTFIGSTGNDTLNGETDTDTADYSTLGQAITLLPTGIVNKGTSGTDNLIGIERVIGATGLNNILNASTATNLFAAATINANLLTQTVTVNAGLTAPLSLTVQNFATVIGTGNNDTLTGDNNANTLTGNAGDDILTGNGGDDTINAGEGNDQVFGNDGNDTIIGSSGGDDTINGGSGSDSLDYSALTEAVTLLAKGFVDKGSFGIDTIIDVNAVIGATGKNNIIDASTGTSGTTSLVADLSINSLKINGLPAPVNSLTFTVQNFTNIIGTTQEDSLKGNSVANELVGNAGNDTLRGESGDDILDGGDGSDQLFGGNNDDQLDGGDGSDRLQGDTGNDVLLGDLGNDTLFGNNGNDFLDGGLGQDSLSGGANDDILVGDADNDVLNGETGNDLLFGDDGDDRVYGNDGNDELSGGTGKDLLYGGNNNDTIFGEDGNDLIYGEAGDDLLFGGKGNDTLQGGLGNDTFAFASGDGRDLIQNFQDGFDKIGLSGGLLFTQLTILGSGTNTLVRNNTNSEILATIQGISSSLITSVDFVTV